MSKVIKVPATDEGLPAIETLIGEGINVNVTLIFSLNHYDAISEAYLRGLDRNPDPSGVARTNTGSFAAYPGKKKRLAFLASLPETCIGR